MVQISRIDGLGTSQANYRITSYNVCYTKLLRAGARGAEPDFAERYLRPFARRVGEAASKAAGSGRYMLFIESVPNVAAPKWADGDAKASGVSGAANAGHWYDGFTLFMKRRVPFGNAARNNFV